MVFADTSFLCALFFQQANTARAGEAMDALGEPLVVSDWVEIEFLHGVRFEVFRHAGDHTRGCDELHAFNVLAAYELAVEEGRIRIVPCDGPGLRKRALELSARHTVRLGCRLLDLLHVAAALELGAPEFLTFDAGQRALAEAESLVIPL